MKMNQIIKLLYRPKLDWLAHSNLIEQSQSSDW